MSSEEPPKPEEDAPEEETAAAAGGDEGETAKEEESSAHFEPVVRCVFYCFFLESYTFFEEGKKIVLHIILRNVHTFSLTYLLSTFDRSNWKKSMSNQEKKMKNSCTAMDSVPNSSFTVKPCWT